MAPENEAGDTFQEPQDKRDDILHIHFIHRHVPTAVSYPLLLLFLLIVGMSVFLYAKKDNETKVVLKDSENKRVDFTYGSWPALENAEFFEKTKKDLIAQETSFIEANLSSMVIRLYQEGELTVEAPIQTKGRDGSWWETPAGLYKVSSKKRNHFSSFGGVYMPWSMQFQGNFFIHGPTYYPDGTPTASTYSGGCIRVALDDVQEIYRLAEVGTPILVFEQSFNEGNKNEEKVVYKNKGYLSDNIVYLAADLENNFVFAENRSREKHSIASLVKLMTALIAVEYINVEKEVVITPSMRASTSIPRLQDGERVAVLDLLSLLLLESSNEAAHAVVAPLGEKRFIKLMNTKANAIGMEHSVFSDTSGVLSNNVSTAEDLFHIAKYLYHNRSFILQMSMGEENRAAYGSSKYGNLSNLNKIPGIAEQVGGKTGLSSSAGDSMLSVFEVEISSETRPIAIIVLGSDDAKQDVEKLLRYIKENFALEAR